MGIGTPFFSGGASRPAHASYKPSTVDSAAAIVAHDGSVGGGVMLEDVAAGLPPLGSVYYDGRYNTLVVNNRQIYFMKVLPWDAAALCREIANDKNTLVGISMGETVFMFGERPSLYENSDVGRTLVLIDLFLGDLVFGWGKWTAGYNFPGGYQLKTAKTTDALLVRSAFKEFQFTTIGTEIGLANLAVDVTLMPVSDEKAPNGGMLPDRDALRRGYRPPAAFLANVQFFTTNFEFFRRERFVAKTIAYGELAALFRAYKQAGRDLNALALQLERG